MAGFELAGDNTGIMGEEGANRVFWNLSGEPIGVSGIPEPDTSVMRFMRSRQDVPQLKGSALFNASAAKVWLNSPRDIAILHPQVALHLRQPGSHHDWLKGWLRQVAWIATDPDSRADQLVDLKGEPITLGRHERFFFHRLPSTLIARLSQDDVDQIIIP